MIEVLEIRERRKAIPIAPASPNDFVAHSIGQADTTVLISDPTISLYCLDHTAGNALFVQLPPEVDLIEAAFMYMAQFDHAQHLLVVPYNEFHAAAAEVKIPASLVCVHSTGRAGSTLLSKALGRIQSTRSLSEPDVYTQLVKMRLSGVPDDDIRQLLMSATRILFKTTSSLGTALNVVKFRSFGIEIGDLFFDSFPDAGNVFLYRDLAPYVRSAARAFSMDDAPSEAINMISEGLNPYLPLLARELRLRNDLDIVDICCLVWLSAVHAYSRVRASGIPISAVRYEDLVSEPSQTLETLLTGLGLPAAGASDALAAFEHDSQAGSPLSREAAARRSDDINSRQWESVRGLVRRYPVSAAEISEESFAVP